MTKPDPSTYNPDPAYLRKLVEKSGLSQRKCAAALAVDERTMRAWLAGDRAFPYTAQFAMERLAERNNAAR